MFDVMTFGEGMLRLSTVNYERLEQSSDLKMDLGGAEVNVAVGVSRLGLSSSWVSLFPDNPLGYAARNKVRSAGVDTSYLKFSDKGRMGLYYVEFGANPRRTKVFYDREDSSISNITRNDFDFSAILKTRLFHVSGITPALSDTCAAATKEAIAAARQNKALISFDVNYRSKLWKRDKAREVLEPLMTDVDIMITTEEDTDVVFGIQGKDYEDVARKLHDKFGCSMVVITIRENISVWKNKWTALAYDGSRVYRDRTYDLEIVDRFGGGDSFSAGFIYGILEKKGDAGEALRYGNAFSALKHSNRTDFNWATLSEVENLLSQTTFRVER
jgi:2-dehydro-3-deoxygluconokinase